MSEIDDFRDEIWPAAAKPSEDVKRAERERLLAESRFYDYLRSFEKEAWLDVLFELKLKISGEDWAEIVRFAWIDSDSLSANIPRWKETFEQAKEFRKLMTEEEHEALSKMADIITVYRGCTDQNLEGLSWSKDRTWAEYFARRSVGGYLVKGKALKADVIAFFDRYDEEKEIVVLPQLVRHRTFHQVGY